MGKSRMKTFIIFVSIWAVIAFAIVFSARYFSDYFMPASLKGFRGQCWLHDPSDGFACACSRKCGETVESPDELYEKGKEKSMSYSGNSEVLYESADLFCMALCKDPKFGPAYAGLAETVMDFDSSRETLEETTRQQAWNLLTKSGELSPDDDRYMAAMFRYYANLSNKPEDRRAAKEWLWKAIEKNPNVSRYHRYKARFLRGYDISAALLELDTAFNLARSNMEKGKVKWEIAEVHRRDANYESWDAAIREAINLHPEDAWYYNDYSSSLIVVGRCEEARKNALKALDVMEFGMAHKNLAQAEDCIEKQKPFGNPPPEFSKAAFLERANKPIEALPLLEEALKKQPKNLVLKLIYLDNLANGNTSVRSNLLSKEQAEYRKGPPSDCERLLLEYFTGIKLDSPINLRSGQVTDTRDKIVNACNAKQGSIGNLLPEFAEAAHLIKRKKADKALALLKSLYESRPDIVILQIIHLEELVEKDHEEAARLAGEMLAEYRKEGHSECDLMFFEYFVSRYYKDRPALNDLVKNLISKCGGKKDYYYGFARVKIDLKPTTRLASSFIYYDADWEERRN